ncbi:MAG: ABC-ATPase domain-containing protein [Thermoplasmata archaeon]|nr:MAG: ABC-ATPase domain-containing protein [Thermoplasmata archaeon]
MASVDDLQRILTRIDGRGYKAYKDIQGNYEFENFILYIDHVQGDPFASPSKVRVRVPQDKASLPSELFRTKTRRIALQDVLARKAQNVIIKSAQGKRGTGKSGLITIDAGNQEVLERTAVIVTKEWAEARLQVGLPARGRRVLGRQAEIMLAQEIPNIVNNCLLWVKLPQADCQRFVECIENQEYIRTQLYDLGLVALVGDGSILPRKSGATDLPLTKAQAVLFQSEQCLPVTIEVPNPIQGNSGSSKSISGMGIPKGVTLIVGGGYHGKSTLLRALERGVYPHIPEDGREYVVTSSDAVKIRAEDGRRIENVDISPFITNLPYGRSTTSFSTDDASGSTSQAANIVEALEVGAKILLLDEDTSATNFMVRDGRMQALVHKKQEPITPFLDRVKELSEDLGVSTVLVMGGCGDYFDVADTVIKMLDYIPHDVTEEAKNIANDLTTSRKAESFSPLNKIIPRIPSAKSFNPSRGKRDVKIDAKALDLIVYGREPIDLRCVEQLLDKSQTRAVGNAIHLASKRFMDEKATLLEVVNSLNQFLDEYGLDALDPYHRNDRHPGNFARPRKYEIAAAINRLRTLNVEQRKSE